MGEWIGAEVVTEVVVEVVVWEAVKVVRADFFVFLRRDYLRKMMGVRAVI